MWLIRFFLLTILSSLFVSPMSWALVATSSTAQNLLILNQGLASLEKRLQMIESAQTQINFETFILEPDESQRAFLQTLIKKSQAGVKVRVLLDKPPVYFFMTDIMMYYLVKQGIEVKLYNPVSFKNIFNAQIRNHKKTLSIDGAEAMIGGRNHADSYFSMSHKYNYLDRDIALKGSLVTAIDESFMQFWQHKMASDFSPEKLFKWQKKEPEKFAKQWQETLEYFTADDKSEAIRQKVALLGGELLRSSPQGECFATTFAADHPGRDGVVEPIVHEELFKRIKEAKTSLKVDSPYFVHMAEDWKLLIMKVAGGLLFETHLNSYAKISDSFLTLNYFNFWARWWARRQAHFFVTTGKMATYEVAFDEAASNTRWGTHSKSFIFDEERFMIGSYNFDPRSKFYSAEEALFCDDGPELARSMVEQFELNKNQGLKLDDLGRPPGGHLQGLTSMQKFIYHLQTLPALLFKRWI